MPDRKTRAARVKALDALGIEIEKIKTSIMYRISLVLATMAIVMLPLIYVAIVIVAAWGTYWYARHGGVFAVEFAYIAFLLTRFGPVVAGTILIFFLLKPILARPPEATRPHTLTRDRYPYLYQFVDCLCSRLGSPAPYRIDADLQVNAMASFATGLSSLLTGRLALTIGLPLVSSMRLREFTVILAHEFGHFSQGAGMRFYYLSAMVNQWFARVIFERDRWDEWLDRRSKNDWGIQVLVFNLARLFIWISRKILFLLMIVSEAIRSLMSRQMEFDADQNAVRICGVRSFTQSMETLPLIEAASDWASAANNLAYRQGRLADNYPYLIQQGIGKIDESVRQQIFDQSSEETVSMYASHPPMAERVARAKKHKLEGTFDIDEPASVLFDDYAGLCREVTVLDYKSTLGNDYQNIQVIPAADVESEFQAFQDRALEGDRYFLGNAPGPATLNLEPLDPHTPSDPQDVINALKEISLQLPALVKKREVFGENVSKYIRATAAKKLLAHNLVVIDPDHANSRWVDADKAARAASEAIEADDGRTSLGQALRNRISLTLDLLRHPSVADRIKNADLLATEAQRAVSKLARLKIAGEQAFRVNCQFAVIQTLLQQIDGQVGKDVDRLLRAETRELHTATRAMRKTVPDEPWPLDDVDVTFADYLVPKSGADPHDLDAQVQIAAAVLERWQHLIVSLTSAIARAGLAVEDAIGLSPHG